MNILYNVVFVVLFSYVYGNTSDSLRLRELEKTVEKQSQMIETLIKIVASQEERIKNLEANTNTVFPEDVEQLRPILSNNTHDAITPEVHIKETNPEKLKSNVTNVDSTDNDEQKKRLLLQPGVAPTTVGFYAYLSKSETAAGQHHTIIFDHVVTNIGNAYNKHAGDFVAPSDGIYVFSYTIYCGYRSDIFFEMVVNSVPMCVSRADSRLYDFDESSSATIVLSLNTGDTCFIRTRSSGGMILSENYERSTFSGWKISAEL